MKRIICIISAVALLLACFNLFAFAADDSYNRYISTSLLKSVKDRAFSE